MNKIRGDQFILASPNLFSAHFVDFKSDKLEGVSLSLSLFLFLFLYLFIYLFFTIIFTVKTVVPVLFLLAPINEIEIFCSTLNPLNVFINVRLMLVTTFELSIWYCYYWMSERTVNEMEFLSTKVNRLDHLTIWLKYLNISSLLLVK